MGPSSIASTRTSLDSCLSNTLHSKAQISTPLESPWVLDLIGALPSWKFQCLLHSDCTVSVSGCKDGFFGAAFAEGVLFFKPTWTRMRRHGTWPGKLGDDTDPGSWARHLEWTSLHLLHSRPEQSLLVQHVMKDWENGISLIKRTRDQGLPFEHHWGPSWFVTTNEFNHKIFLGMGRGSFRLWKSLKRKKLSFRILAYFI